MSNRRLHGWNSHPLVLHNIVAHCTTRGVMLREATTIFLTPNAAHHLSRLPCPELGFLEFKSPQTKRDLTSSRRDDERYTYVELTGIPCSMEKYKTDTNSASSPSGQLETRPTMRAHCSPSHATIPVRVKFAIKGPHPGSTSAFHCQDSPTAASLPATNAAKPVHVDPSRPCWEVSTVQHSPCCAAPRPSRIK
jgi:hypothetical protein